MAEQTKLKVAFPHMGFIYIAWASALRKVGVEPFVPPITNKRTLSLGIKYSPESICLPYKLILGNFVEAIEGGADYVSMICSPGICRLGEYGQSICSVLKDLGYEDKYKELNLYDGFKGMYQYLKDIAPKSSLLDKILAINIVIRKVFVLDRVHDIFSFYRA